MYKQRQDVWSKEDDKYLGETVIKHISAGSTQLAAFEEAGDKLDRTSAACGFRFNAVVRHGIKDEIDAAKKERNALKVYGRSRKMSPPKPVSKDAERPSWDRRETENAEQILGGTEALDSDLEFLPQTKTEGKVEEIEEKPATLKMSVSIDTIMSDIQSLIDMNNELHDQEMEQLRAENAELKAKLAEVSNMFAMLKGLNL